MFEKAHPVVPRVLCARMRQPLVICGFADSVHFNLGDLRPLVQERLTSKIEETKVFVLRRFDFQTAPFVSHSSPPASSNTLLPEPHRPRTSETRRRRDTSGLCVSESLWLVTVNV